MVRPDTAPDGVLTLYDTDPLPEARFGESASISLGNSALKSSKPHQHSCTICLNGLAGRYEWIRQEESVHFPRILWMCRFSSAFLFDRRDSLTQQVVFSTKNAFRSHLVDDHGAQAYDAEMQKLLLNAESRNAASDSRITGLPGAS